LATIDTDPPVAVFLSPDPNASMPLLNNMTRKGESPVVQVGISVQGLFDHGDCI
jgi:hypothetical protein